MRSAIDFLVLDESGAALGRHFLIELYRCDRSVLDDLERLSVHLLEAARRMGATIVGHRFHRFSPQGVSGVVIIAESHLALHTWPEHGYAALDLFTCGWTLRAEDGFRFLEAELGAQSAVVTEIPRGVRARIDAIDLTNDRYEPLHPELFRYDGRFVDRFLDRSVRHLTAEGARAAAREIAEQVYQVQLFTPEFCRLLIEECEHCGAWRTVKEKTVEPHSATPGIADVIEPETAIPWSAMLGLEGVYDAVVSRHVRPLLEGLWETFELQKWDPPAVRKFESDVVGGMDLHYDAETVGMVGYLSEAFEGGGTHFPRWNLTVGQSGNVRVGSVIVYPGGLSHEHLALPVTAGTRYTLSNSFY